MPCKARNPDASRAPACFIAPFTRALSRYICTCTGRRARKNKADGRSVDVMLIEPHVRIVVFTEVKVVLTVGKWGGRRCVKKWSMCEGSKGFDSVEGEIIFL